MEFCFLPKIGSSYFRDLEDVVNPKNGRKKFLTSSIFLRSWRNFWPNRQERTIGQISKNGEVVTKNQPRSHPIR